MSVETASSTSQVSAPFDAEARESWWQPERPRRIKLRVAIAIAFAIAAAAVTYGISTVAPATYRSSAQLRVDVNEATGLGLDAVSASNQLTAQYVQLVPTDAVLTAPAAKLGMSVTALRNSISAGTVAQQNLLQISADASSASAARQRADTVTRDLVSFLASDTRRQLHAYLGNIAGQLRAVDNSYARLAARLRRASGAEAAFVQGELGALTNQQQSLQNQLTQHATSGVPVIQIVQPAGSGAKVAPRPALYAIVAFLVAGFVAAQAMVWDYRRRART